MDAIYQIYQVTPDQAEILNEKMDAFNAEQLHFFGKVEELKNYIIKDSDFKIIAGIRACLYLKECLYISVLFVDEKFRGKGLGSMLLKKLEQEARTSGVNLVHLDTFDFQAKDFYLKNGYEVFGVLDHCPAGHQRFYMKKMLK